MSHYVLGKSIIVDHAVPFFDALRASATSLTTTTMTLKLKPDSASSPRAPFSWDNLPPSPSVSSPSEAPPSPPTLWLDAKQMKIFGAEPLRPEFGFVRCKDCDKPIQKNAITDHTGECFLISW